MTVKAADPALREFMAACQSRLEGALSQWLPPAATLPATLHKAMRYAVLDGGKRIRPTLVYASGQAVGSRREVLDGPACAIEFIHAYSLIHDDLPAMDDDDLRRGKPSCHKAFGEASAILAGDALQSLAFYVMSHDNHLTDTATRLRMIETLALAAGSRGMVGGQTIDIEAAGRQLDIAELEDMHIHKTGALIRASVVLGALTASGLEESTLERLDHYAKCIGLAFQVRDDILDVEGDTATLGKTQGKDRAGQKPTYPSLLGLTASREMALRLCQEALDSLEPLDQKADQLRSLANYIVDRSY